jgi:hypothetical protein
VDASAFELRLELLGSNLCFGLHGSWTMNRLTIAICNVGAKRGALFAWATAAGLHHRRVVFILNLRDSPGGKPHYDRHQQFRDLPRPDQPHAPQAIQRFASAVMNISAHSLTDVWRLTPQRNPYIKSKSCLQVLSIIPDKPLQTLIASQWQISLSLNATGHM